MIVEVTINDLQLEGPGLSDFTRCYFKPREDLEAWPLSDKINWAADPYHDRNWRFHLNALRMVDPYIREYEYTQNNIILHDAVKYFCDWYEFHIVLQKENSYAWYDMSAGQRAAKIAYFINLINSKKISPSAQVVEIMFTMAKEHIKMLSDVDAIAPNNHGLFQVFGLKLLCEIIEDRAAEKIAYSKYKEILECQFTSEGVHTENSPDYHFFTQNVLLRSSVARRFGSEFNDLVEKIRSVNPWLVLPDGKIVQIGDSASSSNPLDKDPDSTYSIANKKYSVGDFTKSGYAVIRSAPSQSNNSMLFVTGMAHVVDHKHADELSFILFEKGREIFIDSGKYGYKSDENRLYVLSASAHNTISVKDEIILPKHTELSGSLIQPVKVIDDYFMVTGSVIKRSFFTQERTITYKPNKNIVISDVVSSEVEKNFVSSLHLAPDLHPNLLPNGFTVELGDCVITAIADGADYVEVVRGENAPLLGWRSTSYLSMEPTSVVRAVSAKTNHVKISWSVSFSDTGSL